MVMYSDDRTNATYALLYGFFVWWKMHDELSVMMVDE